MDLEYLSGMRLEISECTSAMSTRANKSYHEIAGRPFTLCLRLGIGQKIRRFPDHEI